MDQNVIRVREKMEYALAKARDSGKLIALPDVCLAEMMQNDSWASTVAASLQHLRSVERFVVCLNMPRLINTEIERKVCSNTLVDSEATHKIRSLISQSANEATVRAFVKQDVGRAIEWNRRFYAKPQMKEWLKESVKWLRDNQGNSDEFKDIKQPTPQESNIQKVALRLLIEKWAPFATASSVCTKEFVGNSVYWRLFMALSLLMVDSVGKPGWVNKTPEQLRNDFVWDPWYIVLGSFAHEVISNENRVVRLARLSGELAALATKPETGLYHSG